ncbi:hypothetical protein VSX64_03355 [Aurantimonas sp. C2-6-R+9]|nr:hypothetical protein [Aurantimonas sp. C2-6-R+9]
MSDDLREACLAALSLDPQDALDRSRAYSWDACADIFLKAVAGAIEPSVEQAFRLAI